MKKDERMLQEKKAKELAQSNLIKMQEKVKEKENLIREAAKSKKTLEKKELAFQQEEEQVCFLIYYKA